MEGFGVGATWPIVCFGTITIPLNSDPHPPTVRIEGIWEFSVCHIPDTRCSPALRCETFLSRLYINAELHLSVKILSIKG